MRLIKIAFYTALIFIVGWVIFYSLFTVGLSGLSKGVVAWIYLLGILLPLASGIYFFFSGVTESFRQKTFKFSILYGFVLVCIGVLFFLSMIFRNING